MRNNIIIQQIFFSQGMIQSLDWCSILYNQGGSTVFNGGGGFKSYRVYFLKFLIFSAYIEATGTCNTAMDREYRELSEDDF